MWMSRRLPDLPAAAARLSTFSYMLTMPAKPSSSSFPASVRARRPAFLSNTARPTSRSRDFICTDMAGWVMPISSAARVRLRWRPTLMKHCILNRSIWPPSLA